MGKPIAGRGQYPFNVGGILTNGAKINGNVYIKSLYIYKQRSYNFYDLIDDDGNIYEFIEIVYRNEENNTMDYYDIDINLANSLRDGTFYIKEQDPARNIYGFSTLYQYNKIKIHDGNYIFRRSDDIDYSLLAVKLTPNDIVLQVGQSIEVLASYIPLDYQKNNGTWDFSNSSCVITNATDELGNLTIKGNRPGFTTAAFTPEDNDTLTAIVLIRVVEQDVKLNSIIGVVDDERTYPGYMLGEEFDLQLVTEPFNFELPPVDISGINSEYFELVKVSEDNKRYTFKVISDKDAVPYNSSNVLSFPPPKMVFHVDDHDYTVSQYTFSVRIVTKTPVETFKISGVKGLVYGTTGQYTATFDKNFFYYKSDPAFPLTWYIGSSTTPGGVITKTDNDLVVNYTAPEAPNAWRNLRIDYKGRVKAAETTVWFAYHDFSEIYIKPYDVTLLRPGDTLQLEALYVPDVTPHESYNHFRIPQMYADLYKDFFSMTPDGLITVNDNISRNIELRPEYATYDTIDVGYYTKTKYIALMIEDVEPTSLVIQAFGRQFGKVGETKSFNVTSSPVLNSHRHMSYEVEDPSVAEVLYDKTEYSLNCNWGNFGYDSYITIKGISGGTTKVKVWCTDRPELSDTLTITFY